MSAAGLSKGQRRLLTILREMPAAREQLLVAIESFGPGFEEDAVIAAARAVDAHERNRVAVVERQYEVLLDWLHELAARGLAEGLRLGAVERSADAPWQRLAALGAISHTCAQRLQEAKEVRDALAHAYPPANWRALHEGVLILLDELDRYLVGFERWAREEAVLP